MTDNDMVYRGDPDLIHITDGARALAGVETAFHIEKEMRRRNRFAPDKALCPGCYMVVLYNAALALADNNNQSRRELALTMANAFTKLAENPEMGLTEEIKVILDPC